MTTTHTLDQLRAGQLDGVRRLDLSCGLTEFPEEIFRLADSLEILNLSGNALRDLPRDLGRLHRLRVLFCSDNRFTHVPDAVGRCAQLHTVGFKANQVQALDPAALPPRLRALILTDNQLEEVPGELGQCAGLQKIMLSGNRLQALPQALSACGSLELLRIAANRFERLPEWLWRLPRLAWLACGGNPLTEPGDVAEPGVCEVDWHQLSLHEVLGQGTSGLIHRAAWRRGGPDAVPQPVAVKLFKGQGRVTSDGLPRSEMRACLRAGSHPNVIGAQGRVAGHPEGVPGLVMPLMDPALRVLAGPPSLESCTRDVHDGAVPLTPPVVWRLALGVARAAAHLHARGILHGDLYAHNILWAGQGEDVVLGDFGAAALMPADDPATCVAMQRLEVLSFGWLLAELMARCGPVPAEGDDARMLAGLADVQRRCCVEEPAARPLFAEVCGRLEDLVPR